MAEEEQDGMGMEIKEFSRDYTRANGRIHIGPRNKALKVIARKLGPVRTRKPGPMITRTGATINEYIIGRYTYT